MKHIRFAVVVVTLLICATAASAQQQCPGTDPNVCWEQYSTCYADNEGKNCDWRTCQAYCDNEYDQCLYGQKGYTWSENPVVSRSVDTSVGDGDDIGCVAGCSAWGCFCMYNWIPYRRYHTNWQEIHYQHRVCPDNSQYDEIVQIVNHNNDLCYQRDDECTAWDQDCMGGSYCQFTDDGTEIVIH